MKTHISVLSAAIITFGIFISPAMAAEPVIFSDISPDAWYAPYVEVCAEQGLMKGRADGSFDPQGTVTSHELIAAAARLYWTFHGGEGPLPQAPKQAHDLVFTTPDGTPILPLSKSTGLEYASSNGLVVCYPEELLTPYLELESVSLTEGGQGLFTGSVIDSTWSAWGSPGIFIDLFWEPERVPALYELIPALDINGSLDLWAWDAFHYAWDKDLPYISPLRPWELSSRNQMAEWLMAAVPEAFLPPAREVESLPDMADCGFTDGLLAFYRAGVLSGTDALGSFSGSGELSRAELAAILARLTEPALRDTAPLETRQWPPYTLSAPIVIDTERFHGADPFIGGSGEEADFFFYAYVYEPDGPGTRVGTGSALLDRRGEVLFYQRNSYVDPFLSDGIANVFSYAGEENLYGFVDLKGNLVVPMEYPVISQLHDGILLAGDHESGFTAFDTQGKVLSRLPADIDAAAGIHDSRVAYSAEGADGALLWGYRDLDGKEVIPAQYDEVSPFSGGEAAVWLGNQMGMIDTGGNLISPMTDLETLEAAWEQEREAPELPPEPGCYPVCASYGFSYFCCGYEDETGTLFLPMHFYGVSPFLGREAIVATGEGWQLLTLEEVTG